MTKKRKSTIPIQFDQYQVENMDLIVELEQHKSYAELMRRAFDYYVKAEYPQLIVKAG